MTGYHQYKLKKYICKLVRKTNKYIKSKLFYVEIEFKEYLKPAVTCHHFQTMTKMPIS